MSNEPELLNNPHAPDVFADAAVGFFSFNGCMRITFEALRSDYRTNPANVDHVVIGRLVMPILAAKAMAETILNQIEAMQSESAAPTTAIQ